MADEFGGGMNPMAPPVGGPVAPTAGLGAGIDVGQEDIEVDTEPSYEPNAEEVRDTEMAHEDKVQYDLSPEEKLKITEHICQLVDTCKKDREEWQEIRTECIDLLNGKREPKSDPWENCSNIDTMAAATHCKTMHAKLFPSVWNEESTNWVPIEKSDVANVDKVKKFMKWVVRQDIKMQDLVDDIIWDIITNGTVALKTRWVNDFRTISEIDEDGNVIYTEIPHQHCVVDNVSIDEVYLPDLWKGVDKSEYIAQDIYMRLPEIQDSIDRHLFEDVDIKGAIAPTLDEHVPDTMREEKKEIEGTTYSVVDAFKDSLPVRLIECYMKWRVPDPTTGGMKLTESVFTIAYESKTYLSGKPLSAVNPMGRRPWTIGQFMRRTGRPYGISLIEAIRGLVKELNAIHNQRIDAGSISIAPFGFYRAASSFRPDNVTLGPGVMIPVDDINDVKMHEMNHNPVASFQEEKIIIEYMEKLTTTSAYQMGRESDIVKSRATASATMAIISQGQQAFTILGVRCQSIIASLMTQILQQYQTWMPDGFADRILGEDAGELLFSGGLTRADINGEYDAVMNLDATANNSAMERQANAAMVQMGPQLIQMAQDPRGYEMAKDFVLSLGKLEYEKYLGPKPKDMPQGGGMVPPMGGDGGGGMNQDAQKMSGNAENGAGGIL